MYLLADKLGEIVSGAYSWVGLIWLKLSAQTRFCWRVKEGSRFSEKGFVPRGKIDGNNVNRGVYNESKL